MAERWGQSCSGGLRPPSLRRSESAVTRSREVAVISDILIRLRSLFRREAVEAELDHELRFHFEGQVEKYVQSGMPRQQALRRARLEFGGLDQVKEECRDARGVSFIETTIQDVRYGLRVLRKSPGFTAVAVLTLALGIGANTAIFSFLDAALNWHFPIKDQGRIVNLWGSNNSIGAQRSSLSVPDFLDYRQQNRVFEDLAAYVGQSFHLTNVAEPLSLSGSRVSFNYFHVLGVQPAAGRDFLPEESEGGKPRVVILSHGLWQASFGADPAIPGRNITLNRESYTVVGVMPAGFHLFMGDADLWVPLDLRSSALSRGTRQVVVIGRLKPGVSKG